MIPNVCCLFLAFMVVFRKGKRFSVAWGEGKENLLISPSHAHTRAPKKGLKKNTRQRVDPGSSCMRRLLLVYRATSANMKGAFQIIIFTVFPRWGFAVWRSNMSSHLVIPTLPYLVITYSSPTIFIQLKGATFIKFLAFPMRRLFENHIFLNHWQQLLKISINHLLILCKTERCLKFSIAP